MSRKTETIVVAVLLGLAFGLRVRGLDSILLWMDETDFFNEHVYNVPPTPLRQFMHLVERETTNTLGWPAIIWSLCQVLGASATVARLPSAFAGTAFVLTTYLLLRRHVSEPHGSIAGLIAALFSTISIAQLEFSQRTYAYGGISLCSSILIISYLRLRCALSARQPVVMSEVTVALTVTTCVAVAALFVHASLGVLVVAAFLTLARELWRTAQQGRETRRFIVAVAMLALLSVALAWVMNAKHPRYGFRVYLKEYYHGLDTGGIWFIVSKIYDMLVFHLNLFYDPGLYWPRGANVIMAPLVMACLLGWILAAQGQFGRTGRNLAVLFSTCVGCLCILSLLRVFPLGGVRQTLFVTPFTIAFAALGLCRVASDRRGRIATLVAACTYLGLWSYKLPEFYRSRARVFETADLIRLRGAFRGVPWYVDGGGERALRYFLRNEPGVVIEGFRGGIKPPYLLISLHWPMESSLWNPSLRASLEAEGLEMRLVEQRPARWTIRWEDSGTLYFPPSGWWVYYVGRR